jgi:poly(A) polymerase/tRNA nucleotidyltransferase (CCA-adding enzyme)
MDIPKEVKETINKLKENGFEGYIVGGCVRDFLRGEPAEDWDLATNAKPEEIQKIFPDNFYENNFLTVTIQTNSKEEKVKEIEITTYRSEAKYSDKRHPDEIKFAKNLEEDLARRDFTVNAIAMEVKTELKKKVKTIKTTKTSKDYKLIDPFDGQKDLKKKILKAVGDPSERFNEDALRMMRGVRFSTTLNFEIEKNTKEAIKKNSHLLKEISQERIRDEFLKMIMSDRASDGIELLRELGLLKYIIPELEEGYEVGQNKHHIYDCYQHNLLSLKFACEKKFNKYVRIAALLHDIAKPRAKQGDGPDSTFYNHEIIGAKMTNQILERLKFPKKEIEKIYKLVRFHLFYYNVGEVGEASIRRLVRNVGAENMEELLQLRMADRIGSGVPKAEPYKLRHFKYLIDKVAQDPISAKMLKVNGNDIITFLKITPGPKVGSILDILLSKVLENPENNTKEFLERQVEKLGALSDDELRDMSDEAQKSIEKTETKRDEMTKQKYWVS